MSRKIKVEKNLPSNTKKEGIFSKVPLNNLKRIGTLTGSDDLVWFKGDFAGLDKVRAIEIQNKLPLIVLIPQTINGRDSIELGFIFTESQNVDISINMPDEVEEQQKIFGGLEDLLSSKEFSGVRVARIYFNEKNEFHFEIETPNQRLNINQTVYGAPNNLIETFLATTDFNWLYYFKNSPNKRILLTLLPLLIQFFRQFEKFNSKLFYQKIIEIADKITDGQKVEIIKSLSNEEDDKLLGHVTWTDGHKTKITLNKPINLENYPIITIDNEDGKTFVVLIETAHNPYELDCHQLIALDCASQISMRNPIILGSQVRYSSITDLKPTLTLDKSQTQNLIILELGKLMGIENGDDASYNLVLRRGQLANGLLIGESSKGKSNTIFVFLGSIIENNVIGRPRCGAILFDRHGEYSPLFKMFLFKENFKRFLTIANPLEDPRYKFKISEVPIEFFVKESSAESPDVILKKIMRYTYDEIGLEIPIIGKRQRKDRLSVEALNWIRSTNYDQIKCIKEATTYQTGQINAIKRQLNKFNEYLPILQIEWDETTDNFIDLHEEKDFTKVIYGVQRNGKVCIIDMSAIHSSLASKLYSDLIWEKLHDQRKSDFKKYLKANEGDLNKFRIEMPLIFLINEEATLQIAGKTKDELQPDIEQATGARKFNLGTVYVFQSLRDINPIVLSQLGGFNIVLGLPQKNDRQVALRGVHIDSIEKLEEFIANADTGEAIISCEEHKLRPYFVKIHKAEEYLKKIVSQN